MTAPAIESKKGNANFLSKIVRNQLFIPLVALLLLIIFNLITDPGFFKVSLEPNSDGNMILSGNLITMIDYASELVILAIGMTLVTSASGGQDISVGATIAIAGSTVLRIVKTQSPDISGAKFAEIIILSFLLCVLVSAAFGAFNGALVAFFKIQPMVATLILSRQEFMHWRRKWQPTPVFLPGKSQGRRSLVGYRLWGHTESDTTEVT